MEREERRLEREQRQREEDMRREEKLMTTLREAHPAVPQTITIKNHKLPHMKEREDAELFVAMFEAALRSNNVPQGQWKNNVHANLSLKSKARIQSAIQDNDSTYDEVKEALLGCAAMTFSSAAEDLCTGERGRLFNLDPRQVIDKVIRLVGKLTKDAETKPEILNCIGVALTRNWLDPSLKSYVDRTRKFELNEYVKTIEEWEHTQPMGTSCFKKTLTGFQQPTLTRQSNNQYQAKNPVTCFYCGKQGHMLKECRSWLADDRQTQPSSLQKQVTQ